MLSFKLDITLFFLKYYVVLITLVISSVSLPIIDEPHKLKSRTNRLVSAWQLESTYAPLWPHNDIMTQSDLAIPDLAIALYRMP